MDLTPYHAKYFAHELTKRCSSNNMEKLAGRGCQCAGRPESASVDAALFAFNSPLSRGALLADEVGLGKTIKVGLVLSGLLVGRASVATMALDELVPIIGTKP